MPCSIKYCVSSRYKISLIGDPQVGKTSLRKSFIDQSYDPSYTPTLGAEISVTEHLINFGNYFQKVKLHIWDIVGQQNFKKMRNSYLRNSSMILLVFDLTQHSNTISNWVDEINKAVCFDEDQEVSTSCPPILLVGNKSDLATNENRGTYTLNEVQTTIAEKYSADKIVGYLETSAMTGSNVIACFDLATRFLLMNEFTRHLKPTDNRSLIPRFRPKFRHTL